MLKKATGGRRLLLGLSGVSGLYLNDTNQMNQINQINKTNQTGRTGQTNGFFSQPARSLSDIAFVTRRRRCGQMRDRRPGKTGGVLLEHIEDFFGPRTTQMAADRLPQ